MHIKKYPKDFHDQVAKSVCNHFNNLPKKGKPLPTEWTTLAAIVQSNSKLPTTCLPQNLSVISCATGTRCVGEAGLSSIGDIVHDSHAEVLARRCFLLYLFDQLKLYKSSGSVNSIFEKENNISNSLQPQPYILKEDVEFHLFVSQLPCGDAAIIITEEDIINEPKPEEEPKTKKQKIEISTYRTGAKLQPGPLVYEQVQSVGKCRVKPGKGDPTLSMSCSDKIAKWQILGLQGCLLTNFIRKPIRLSSITIGGGKAGVPFNEESLNRAVYRRFEKEMGSLDVCEGCNFNGLLEDYFVPSFGQSLDNFSNYFDPLSERNPCPSSIIWHRNRSTDAVQVIVNGRKQGATKKSLGKPASMVDICRRNILKLFIDMYFCNSNDDTNKCTSYLEAKRLNQCYTKFWSLLRSKVMVGWTDKPDNIHNFSL